MTKQSEQLEFEEFKKLNTSNDIKCHLGDDDRWKYRINKFWDCIFDNIGWNLYRKCTDIKSWIITTYQKLKYGVSDKECWDLSYTMSEFILKRLKHFKKMKRYGISVFIYSELNINLINPSKTDDDVVSESWEKMIDEMIWTFDYICNDEKYNPIPKSVSCGDIIKDLNRPKTDEEKKLWDDYFNKSEELDKRKKDGLNLFSKYFECLGD